MVAFLSAFLNILHSSTRRGENALTLQQQNQKHGIPHNKKWKKTVRKVESVGEGKEGKRMRKEGKQAV